MCWKARFRVGTPAGLAVDIKGGTNVADFEYRTRPGTFKFSAAFFLSSVSRSQSQYDANIWSLEPMIHTHTTQKKFSQFCIKSKSTAKKTDRRLLRESPTQQNNLRYHHQINIANTLTSSPHWRENTRTRLYFFMVAIARRLSLQRSTSRAKHQMIVPYSRSFLL